MGHYDDAFEADADKRRAEGKAARKKLLKKVEELRREQLGDLYPERFDGPLEDLENWLRVHTS